MAQWVVYPDCLEIDVDVENTFRMPDPLWPGLGFAIAFVVGGLIGGILAKFCLRDYLRKRNQDEEEATLIAQGIPLHLRGREMNKAFPATMSSHSASFEKPARSEFDLTNGSGGRAGAVTPSSVELENTAGTEKMKGFSDALIKSTGEGSVAEIAHQDARNVTLLEEQLREEKIGALICMLTIHLNKLVVIKKISQEDANRIVGDIRNKYDGIVESSRSSEAAAVAALANNPKLAKNSVAIQTETDKLHASAMQKLNWEQSNIEADIPHLLASVETLNEDDIEAVMAKLKHQLATREKKVTDETRRQIQAMEERLARRRELAEQNRLTKVAAADTVTAKADNQSNNLRILVGRSALDEKQKEKIMRQYEEDLWNVQQANEQERAEQEHILNEKLAKKRRTRLKKLSSQHEQVKGELQAKLKKSSNNSDIKAYDEVLHQQHTEFEDVIAGLDESEAKQLNELAESAQHDFESQLHEVDGNLADSLVTSASVDEDDVNKVLKLHNAEMKEYQRKRLNNQRIMEAKLQEKLALKKQQREEGAVTDQKAFHALKKQQEDMVHKVLQSQADITEEAVATVIGEHKRNMEIVNNQLSISKLRQEKQLEERLMNRRARLAEKQQAQQALSKSAEENQSSQEKIQREIEEEKLKIKQEHELAVAALKQRMQEETQEALAAQELQISQLIGQLEVGQARRKNILQKQDKLIGELENQLSNKVGENPKGYTTTAELMQKHYGQVDALTNSLQNTKERQEQALQERLEQKRLRREAEIREQMKVEANVEMEKMRARGAGVASNILLDMMLQQRHERAVEELEQEMKVELQRSRDRMNEELNAEMMAALSDEGKNFMAEMAANSGLTNEDLTEAMQSAASEIQANDQTVKKLAKEMKVRVKTARGERSQPGY